MYLSKFYFRSALLIVGLSLLGLLSIPLVKADAVQFNVASKHLTYKSYNYSEFNPGVTVSKNLRALNDGKGYALAGYYRNSLKGNSFFAGIGWREGLFGMEFGGITGYTMPVSPLVSPYMQYSVFKANIIPIVSHKAKFDGVALGLSLNFEVNK